MSHRGLACLVVAAVLASAGVGEGAADLVSNARFERAFGPLRSPEPEAFGLHRDDRERSPVQRSLDDPALIALVDRNALAVLRPPGDALGVAWSSSPVRVSSGRSLLWVIGWQPLAGQAEAALVVRGADGRILLESSVRLTLLPDGRALQAPLRTGSPLGPWLFPPERLPADPVESVAVLDAFEARVRIDPLPADAWFAEIELGHGSESNRALYLRASLLDLSEGLAPLRTAGMGAAVAAAPGGVLLDPLAPPLAGDAVDALRLEGAPGERVDAALLLGRSSGAVELEGEDLRRVGVASQREDPAEGAVLRRSSFALGRSFSPRVTRIDSVFPAADTRGEPSALNLALHIPDGTPGGLYRGRLQLRPQSGASAEFPVEVRVREVPVAGNLVPDPGFELALRGRPAEWRVSGVAIGSEPSDAIMALSGRRSLLLAHAPLEAVFVEAESGPCLPVRDQRHRLVVHLRAEGDPGAAEVELDGVGRVRLVPVGEPPHVTLGLGRAHGLDGVSLAPLGDGWLRLEATADLAGTAVTRLRVRSDPAPGLGASALRVDDVALVALPAGFAEVGRYESRIANGGFESTGPGEPLEPAGWTVAAETGGARDRAVSREDLVVEAPVAAGVKALLITAGGGPGEGLEARSLTFPVAPGERLELRARLKPSGAGARLAVTLRAFDADGRAMEGSPGARFAMDGSRLRAIPSGARVELDAADGAGFHAVEIRVLDLPAGAIQAALAFGAPPDAAPDTWFVVDEARVAPVRTRLATQGLTLDGLARWYGVRLWSDDTDASFESVFEQLARLGVAPDSPAPESFEDFRKPFPSLAPPLLAPSTARRHARWAEWWWRRGFATGALAPVREDLPRALEAFYGVWMPPLRNLDLARLGWAPAPLPEGVSCIVRARDMKLEGWARTLDEAAPELRRLGRPCTTLDAQGRAGLAGIIDAWVLPSLELGDDLAGPGARLERRERGDLLLADLAPDLGRLDLAPARPRAALWRAWRLGFDGWSGEGLTRWQDIAGAGPSADGALTADSRLVQAPGALLWPGPRRRVEPSQRLLQLARGIADLRLFRTLEEWIGEGESAWLDGIESSGSDGGLEGALDQAEAALASATALAAMPPGEASAAELDAVRARVLAAAERLWPRVREARELRALEAEAATTPSRR